MRCLHCGKDVPLLKRLAGNEFCSDAHRREYQREYSQLALGRLLQSKPSDPEKKPAPTERVATAPGLHTGKSERPALAFVNGAAPVAANQIQRLRELNPRATGPSIRQEGGTKACHSAAGLRP